MAAEIVTCRKCEAVAGADGTPLLRCGACKTVYYCGVAHQKEDWKSHKQACKLTQSRAEESATPVSASAGSAARLDRSARATDLPPFRIEPVRHGLGAVATRLIRKGETVLEEDPLLTTSTNLMKEHIGMTTGISYGDDLTNIFDNELTPEQQKCYMELHDCYESKAIKKTVRGVFLTNNLSNRFNGSHTPIGVESQGGSVFAQISRFNHSCSFNAVFLPKAPCSTGIGRACIRACCDIPAGEELCIAYIDPLHPQKARKELLRERYGFDCTCRTCTAPNPGESDGRRERLKTWVGKYCCSDDVVPGDPDAGQVIRECLEALELAAAENLHIPLYESHWYQQLQIHFAGIAQALASGQIKQVLGSSAQKRYAEAAACGWKAVESTALSCGEGWPFVQELKALTVEHERLAS